MSMRTPTILILLVIPTIFLVLVGDMGSRLKVIVYVIYASVTKVKNYQATSGI